MKKKKGDVVILFFLIALATLLLYTSISVFFGMDKVLDDAYDKAHTADLFYMSNVEAEKIKEVMTSQEEVAEYEASEALYILKVEYKKEGEKESNEAQFAIGIIEEDRKIGKLVGAEGATINYDSILLPYYMKEASGYNVGDKCYLTIGEKEYRFEVAGFVQDPLFATPLNISVYGAYISESCMEDMIAENSVAKDSQYIQHKVRLKEGEDSFEFDNKISPILTKEIPELSQTTNLGVNWDAMKGGVTMMPQISMGIVLVFSLLLIIVVLIIMRFSIRNYIEMNLKNVGILQAAGYTPAQLNITVIIEMGIISVLAVIAGILMGMSGSEIIGKFQGIMLGIEWKQSFNLRAALLTAVAVLLVVLSVAYISGRLYRKITVLESLRGGIHTHNFKKNYFGFDKSRLPIPLTLAGKNLMCEKAKNISILFVVMILSFAACVGFGMYENFAVDNDTLMKMVGAETGDIVISGENLQEAGTKMEEWTEVKEVLYYSQSTIELESKEEETAVTCDIWQQPDSIHNEMIISGRLPKYDNEIVLTTNIAKNLNVDVGDTIYVTGQGERMPYVVCGIDQKINNMGLKAMLSKDGAVRLNGDCQIMFLYVYTNESITFEDMSEKVLSKYPDFAVGNADKMLKSTMSSVKLAMIAICVIFVIITVFVVTLVEVLLIKSKVIRERKNLGLNKAFGFTTGQLIVQTMMVNIPVIAIGAICGAILSIHFMEPLIATCLSFCGIEKCPFTVDLKWLLITVIGIIVVAMITSFLSSVKIRKIEPVKMLVEE